MKRNTLFKIINVAFIVFLIGLVYFLKNEPVRVAVDGKNKILSRAQFNNQANQRSYQEVTSIETDQLQANKQEIITNVNEKRAGSSGSSAVSSKFNSLKPDQIEKLSAFKELNAKVLLNRDEKENFKKILNDRELISSVAQSYAQSIQNDFLENVYLQNSMNDYLIEALKSGDHNTSRDSIQSIVLDAQVENSDRNMSEREILAGLKAELLYQASAYYPDEFKFKPSRMPGSVTRKILENVNVLHKENEELSRAEYTKLSQK